jgi:ATP-binding cassette subfamily B protein
MTFVTVIIASILPFLLTYISTLVIDEVIKLVSSGIPVTPSNTLIWLMVYYALSNIAIDMAWALNGYFEREQYYKITEFFTLQFLQKSSELDLYHYEDAKKNDVIQRAKESYSWKPGDMANRFTWTAQNVISIITSMGIIAAFSPLFFLILVLSVLPSMIISMKTANLEWGIWNEDTEKRRKFWDTTYYLTDENSLMELRIFKTKNFLFNSLKDMFTDFQNRKLKIARKRAFIDSMAGTISNLGATSFWIYVIMQVLSGQVTIGQLSFYASTAGQLTNNLSALFRNLARNYEDVKYIADYYAFIDFKQNILSGTILLPKTKKPPLIEFKNVDFTYHDNERPVLTNFNLTIEPGEHIALVGENGAGKTTIIKLLSRYYDVSGGQILINGKDIRELDLGSWYSQLGVLFQHFMRYNFLPAKTNISLGNLEANDDMVAIQTAAIKSGAHSFIDKLPEKYEQLLSKRYPKGVDLSGGEWQRLALARGFFRDSNIIILDEPTSAIDAKGESEIFDQLYKFAKGKSVIIISHRFSTVRKADKIYVVDKGMISESGTHQELMKQDGKYAKAFSLQAEGYK